MKLVFSFSVLILDGHTLVESIAIMHYLEETRPQRPLLPQDVHKRCKVREICEVITSGIQPLQNLIVLIHVGEEKKKGKKTTICESHSMHAELVDNHL